MIERKAGIFLVTLMLGENIEKTIGIIFRNKN